MSSVKKTKLNDGSSLPRRASQPYVNPERCHLVPGANESTTGRQSVVSLPSAAHSGSLERETILSPLTSASQLTKTRMHSSDDFGKRKPQYPTEATTYGTRSDREHNGYGTTSQRVDGCQRYAKTGGGKQDADSTLPYYGSRHKSSDGRVDAGRGHYAGEFASYDANYDASYDASYDAKYGASDKREIAKKKKKATDIATIKYKWSALQSPCASLIESHCVQLYNIPICFKDEMESFVAALSTLGLHCVLYPKVFFGKDSPVPGKTNALVLANATEARTALKMQMNIVGLKTDNGSTEKSDSGRDKKDKRMNAGDFDPVWFYENCVRYLEEWQFQFWGKDIKQLYVEQSMTEAKREQQTLGHSLKKNRWLIDEKTLGREKAEGKRPQSSLAAFCNDYDISAQSLPLISGEFCASPKQVLADMNLD